MTFTEQSMSMTINGEKWDKLGGGTQGVPAMGVAFTPAEGLEIMNVFVRDLTPPAVAAVPAGPSAVCCPRPDTCRCPRRAGGASGAG